MVDKKRPVKNRDSSMPAVRKMDFQESDSNCTREIGGERCDTFDSLFGKCMAECMAEIKNAFIYFENQTLSFL